MSKLSLHAFFLKQKYQHEPHALIDQHLSTPVWQESHDYLRMKHDHKGLSQIKITLKI